MVRATLVGARCTLRPLVPQDAPSIAQHADDEAVWRNLFEGFPRPYTLAHAQAWCGDEHRRPAYGQVWAIDADGAAVGCCSVRQDAGWLRCNAEVGYWIGRAHWGHGIASDVLTLTGVPSCCALRYSPFGRPGRLVTAWAWAQLPEVTRLYAPIFAWNAGSQGVARRCGHVKDADLPQSALKDGRVIDRVQYGAYRPSRASLP